MIQTINETTNQIQTTPTAEPTPSKRVVPSQALDIKLARVAEMLAGIQTHTEPLTKRGIDTAFVTKLSASYQATMDTRNERIAYKARMMEKTEALQAEVETLETLYAEARNQVKITFPKATWREFGIVDQRM